MDLVAVLTLLRVLWSLRFVLDMESSVGDERDGLAIWREAGAAVVLRADRQLARPAGSLQRHEPDGVAVAVATRRGRLERDERQCAVRREPRVRRDAQAVQVSRGERTRQAESSGSRRRRMSGCARATTRSLPATIGPRSRPAVAATRTGRPDAAKSSGHAPADDGATLARTVRLDGAPLRTVMGRPPGAGIRWTCRKRGSGRRASPRRRRPRSDTGPTGARRAGGQDRRPIGRPRWRAGRRGRQRPRRYDRTRPPAGWRTRPTRRVPRL